MLKWILFFKRKPECLENERSGSHHWHELERRKHQIDKAPICNGAPESIYYYFDLMGFPMMMISILEQCCFCKAKKMRKMEFAYTSENQKLPDADPPQMAEFRLRKNSR